MLDQGINQGRRRVRGLRGGMLLAALVAALFPAASPATAHPTSTAVSYSGHLTRIADGTNTACATGLRMFVVRAHLQAGHRFRDVRSFRLRLRGGDSLRIRFERWDLSQGGRVATWYARDVGTAKVSRHLRLSRTTFTATPGSRFHAKVSKACYVL
jgi:hypothetical protein